MANRIYDYAYALLENIEKSLCRGISLNASESRSLLRKLEDVQQVVLEVTTEPEKRANG